jgi:hypothetical protein
VIVEAGDLVEHLPGDESRLRRPDCLREQHQLDWRLDDREMLADDLPIPI